MGSEAGDLQSDIDKNLARAEQGFLQELRERAGRQTEQLIAMLGGSGRTSEVFREWLETLQLETNTKERQVVYRLAKYVLFLRRQRQLIRTGDHLEAVFRTLYWLPGPKSVIKGLKDSIHIAKLRRKRYGGGRGKALAIYEVVRKLWREALGSGSQLSARRIMEQLKRLPWEEGVCVTVGRQDYAVWSDGKSLYEILEPPLGSSRVCGLRTLQRYLEEIRREASESR